MNPHHEIDLGTWPRTELFNFYRGFKNPAYNMMVKVNAQPIYDWAKERGESFFLLCLYAILRAANEVPQTRQRWLNNRLIEYETIDAMTPIMTPSELFCQAWLKYRPCYSEFKESSVPVIEAAKKGIPSPEDGMDEDYICASCLPWLHFDGATQADYSFDQTIPILGWGKMKNGEIPIAVRVSHCFMDGLHIARFFERIENGFTKPELLY